MNVDITIPAQSVTVPSQDVSANVPAAQIVYQHSWISQTSGISSETIFTTTSAGLYRLSIGGNQTFSTSSGNLHLILGTVSSYPEYIGPTGISTNNPGINIIISSGVANSVYGYADNSVIYLPDGIDIRIYAAATSDLTAFDLFVTIETLQ